MINAIKNYFIKLWEILFQAGCFGFKNFKSMPLVWLLIIIQLIIGIPLLYLSGIVEMGLLKPFAIVILIAILAIFLLFLFLLFKRVYKIAANALDKEEISNARIIKSLFFLGVFNCIPALFVLICTLVVNRFENTANIMQIASLFFTYVFYIAMSLSICSIVYWQDRNIPSAILNSLKTFFATIKHSMIIFIFMYGLAALTSWIICAIFYFILQHFNILDNALIGTIPAIVNIYCLYVFATFYIGAQAKIIKGHHERI